MAKLWSFLKRLSLVLLIILIFLPALIFLADVIFKAANPYYPKINYGVSFSPKFARTLGLNWQETYIKILDDMKVRNLRIPTYWDRIEKSQMSYDFSETDFILDEAKIRNAKVILTLGARQPRWPECHIPDWAKKLSLEKRQAKTLEFIGRVLERYKHHTAILAWQVENEPLLAFFGEGCDPPDQAFLRSEVELVRKLNGKPIMMTDSGELGFWITPMRFSDIFGTTLYRKVYDQTFGYITYPIPAYFYNLKSTIIRVLFAKNNQETVISELQAEPWLREGVLSQTASEQADFFPVNELKDYINYAKQTGFDEQYLWGVEWWYFMTQNGHPQYLEYAKTLF